MVDSDDLITNKLVAHRILWSFTLSWHFFSYFLLWCCLPAIFSYGDLTHT